MFRSLCRTLPPSILTFILLAPLPAAGCHGEPVAPSDSSSSTLTLSAPDEPGQPLVLYGTVVDSLTDAPLAGARVYLYHADTNGQYRPADPGDESTARLSGEVVTDADGGFVVHTILPGEYDQPGNRHVHVHYARADGYREKGRVILFDDNVNDVVRQWAADTGFGIVIELDDRGGRREGRVTIPLAPRGE